MINRNNIFHSLSHLNICLSCILFTFTFFINAPLEIYMTNVGEFWFKISDIIHIPLICFIFVTVIMIGVYFILPERIKAIYMSMVFSLGLCVYLQGNYFNINIGNFAGKEINWQSYSTRFVVNIMIWLLIIIAFIFLGKTQYQNMEKIYIYVSTVLIIMQLVSLGFLISTTSKERKEVNNLNYYVSDDQCYEAGSDKNVIVIILDAFDSYYFQKILEDGDMICSELDGFTYYANHSGMYASTGSAIPPLMVGRTFTNQMSIKEWLELDEKTYMDKLLDAGYSLGLYTDMLASIPKRFIEQSANIVNANLHFINNRTAFSLLYKMVSCRYLPDLIKPYVWMNGTEFDAAAMTNVDKNKFRWSNSYFRDATEKNEFKVGKGKREYKFIHIYGAHEPGLTDEFGNDIDEHWDMQMAARGALQIALKYIEKLKENGTYDNSAIIITADHGYSGELGVIGNPVMLIKPINASGDLLISNAPTSHADFAATVLNLAEIDNYNDYGESILDIKENSNRKRFSYGYVYEKTDISIPHRMNNGSTVLVEYEVPPEDSNPWKFKVTGKEFIPYGQIINHYDYCETCQNKIEPTPYLYWPIYRHNHTKEFLKNWK